MSVTQVPQGGSGSGGTAGLGTFVTPPTSGWAWTNQGTASVVATSDGSGFTLVKPAIGANVDDYSLYTRALPASRRVSIAMRVLAGGTMSSGQYPSGGICLLESGTGKFIAASIVGSGAAATGPFLQVQKYTNTTTYAGSDYTAQFYHFQDLMRLRLFNGAAGIERRTVQWGLTGDLWLPTNIVDVLWNDFCVPDRIGFCANGFGVAGNQNFGVLVEALSWDES